MGLSDEKMIKVILITLISIILILLLGRDSHKDLKGTLPEQLDQFIEKEDFQGVVLVSEDNQEIFKKGYGMAAPDVPNTPGIHYIKLHL